MREKRPNSVILKHKQKEHFGEEMSIRMEITQKYGDPLTRQANEAVRIKKKEHKSRWTTKYQEWVQSPPAFKSGGGKKKIE